MAKPLFINTPKGTWTKVASSVIRGQISLINLAPSVFASVFRDAGDLDIPVQLSDGIPFTKKTNLIKSSYPIDVYVYAIKQDGQVRVDL